MPEPASFSVDSSWQETDDPYTWTDPIADNAEDTTRLNAVRRLVKAHDEGRYTSLLHYAKAVKAAVDGPPMEETE